MKFDLRCFPDEKTAINHEFNVENIADLLDRLETFVKACGFCYDGYLNIFENDDPSKPLTAQAEGRKDEGK